MSLDTIKIPEPIIEPATIVVDSSSPRPRTNPVFSSSIKTAASSILSPPKLSYERSIKRTLMRMRRNHQEIDHRQDRQNDRDNQAHSCDAGASFRAAFASSSDRSKHN